MLTEAEIKRFIDDDFNSEKKRFAMIGQRYYDGDHDIKQYRMFYYNADGELVEDTTRANNRICHPFFTELVDQLAAYMLSFEENPIRAKANVEGLQDHLDEYFDDEFWAEIQEVISGANSKGFEYLYAHQNEDDRISFHCADGMGVVEVRAKDTDDGCEYIIYWYIDRIDKGKKAIKRIQVHSANETYFYTQVNDGKIVLDDNEPINPKPSIVWKKDGKKYGSGFGYIPFWRLDNNRKQISGLKPIKALIDDYDLMECGLSNNLQDFDKPIHLVKGFEGDNFDELQQNIKTKKMLGVGESGGLEILTVDVPYQARKAKADEDEKNIYRFGMGFNSSQAGDGNVTNVVIRSRYTLLDLKANKLEKQLKKFLKNPIRVVIDEINKKNSTGYQYSDVEIHFDRIIPTNEQENVSNALVEAQTVQTKINNFLNAQILIGDEATLKGICEILDLDFEELKAQIETESPEEDLFGAMDDLEGVEPEDQVPEEPEASGGISTEEEETQNKVLEMLESLLKEVE